MSDPPRRYTEAEMRDVFARAARATPVAPPEGGFTLDELQRIGASAGLDPVQVAAAVASLDRAPGADRTLLGIRQRVEAHRVIPATLSDEAWEQVVNHLRGLYGGPGTSGQMGRVREWTSPGPHSGGGNRAHVHVTARPLDGGMTEVSFSQVNAAVGRQLALALPGVFAASGAVVLLLVGGITGAWGTATAFAAGILVVALLLGALTRILVIRQQTGLMAQFDGLLDRVELLAGCTAPALALEKGAEAAAQDEITDSQTARRRTV